MLAHLCPELFGRRISSACSATVKKKMTVCMSCTFIEHFEHHRPRLTNRSNIDTPIMRGQLANTLVGVAMTIFASNGLACAEELVVNPVAKVLTTNSGQPIVLPSGEVEVTASIFIIPGGASLAVHRHPFPRYGYVLSGALSVTNAETGQATQFKSGDLVIEAVGQWHSGMNPGKEPLRLLVLDQAPRGATNTELQKQ
jgi:quercetin dioxygenase-like cupin family protein